VAVTYIMVAKLRKEGRKDGGREGRKEGR